MRCARTFPKSSPSILVSPMNMTFMLLEVMLTRMFLGLAPTGGIKVRTTWSFLSCCQ